jgi:hypothetical protein
MHFPIHALTLVMNLGLRSWNELRYVKPSFSFYPKIITYKTPNISPNPIRNHMCKTTKKKLEKKKHKDVMNMQQSCKIRVEFTLLVSGESTLGWNTLDVWKSSLVVFKFSIVANSNLLV